MDKWTKIPSDDVLNKTVKALGENGINAEIVDSGQKAKKRVLELLPKGAEVMDMTSRTLDSTGISKEINESGNYDSVRNKLNKMDRSKDSLEMQKLGAAPQYAVGSVHAVTEEGQVIVVSNTGSQLPAYSYGSEKVIWVVGAQKIVKDIDSAIERIYNYVLPLESERVKEAYGMERSNVSKFLKFNKEVKPDRITLIFVKEKLGF